MSGAVKAGASALEADAGLFAASPDEARRISLPYALTMRDVDFAYGRTPVLKGFNLGVSSGILMGVVGPNGSGKSTVLKLAAGLAAPAAGEVLLRDGSCAVGALSARERARQVSYLPQRMPLPNMTVEELALCGRHAHRRLLAPMDARDVRAAHTAMDEAGVLNLKGRPVRELSGGQRQRAYLAMLLSQDARLMLLDEPTSALDIGAAHEMLSLVRRVVRDGGRTAVAVLHDLDLALRYCDEIAVMAQGRLMGQGAPSNVAEGGLLEEAFRISVIRHAAPDGPCYTFHPRPAGA